jgi:GTP-dependent phosphoenolpyruvate carboxykinase
MKYLFDKNKKDKILQGRKIVYVAENILGKQNGYIGNILNGKKTCGLRLANWITVKLDPDADIQDYFKEV